MEDFASLLKDLVDVVVNLSERVNKLELSQSDQKAEEKSKEKEATQAELDAIIERLNF